MDTRHAWILFQPLLYDDTTAKLILILPLDSTSFAHHPFITSDVLTPLDRISHDQLVIVVYPISHSSPVHTMGDDTTGPPGRSKPVDRYTLFQSELQSHARCTW